MLMIRTVEQQSGDTLDQVGSERAVAALAQPSAKAT